MEVYPMRLLPGMEITSSLLQFVRDRGLNAAFLITCCGSVTRAALRYSTTVRDGIKIHEDETFEEPLELLSLSGTVGQDGAYLHACFGKCDGSVVGGRVIGDMVVQTTAEIVLGNAVDYFFPRPMDADTGNNELVAQEHSNNI